jgi:hypothetical protein
VRVAVRLSTAPGSAGEAQTRRPAGSARIWTLTFCRLCLPEWYGRWPATLSIGISVPSMIAYASSRPGGPPRPGPGHRGQVDCLAQVPPHSGDRDGEAGR